MFQFSGSSFLWLCIPHRILVLLTSGFPHSDICGSLLTYGSPQHFAVRRVLLRLLVPRHPLCALSFLTLSFLSRLSFVLRLVVYNYRTYNSEELYLIHPFQVTLYFATSIIQFSKIY